MKHSLCFLNRTALSTWGPLHVPESSFPRVQSPWISSPLRDFRRFMVNVLVCLHSFHEVEVDKTDRVNSKSPVARFSFDRIHFMRKRWAMSHWYRCDWCGWSIKAAPRLAEILMVEFNVTRKNCVIRSLPFAMETAAAKNNLSICKRIFTYRINKSLDSLWKLAYISSRIWNNLCYK